MDYRFRQDRDTVLHRLEDTLRLNKGFIRFFREHAGDRIVSSLFHSKDSLENTPCAIINIPLKDEVHAEKDLRLLLDTLYLKAKKEALFIHQLSIEGKAIYWDFLVMFCLEMCY